eukprot:6501524-Alexandrium_andersonii.AAC.1
MPQRPASSWQSSPRVGGAHGGRSFRGPSGESGWGASDGSGTALRRSGPRHCCSADAMAPEPQGA